MQFKLGGVGIGMKDARSRVMFRKKERGFLTGVDWESRRTGKGFDEDRMLEYWKKFCLRRAATPGARR